MRKQFYKVKQFDKRCLFNFHRRMLSVKYDTMLVIIYIWRVLESPCAVVYRNRYNTVVLSRRMVHASCISFVFHTKLTFRITACLRILSCRNRFRVLLRFGKIDGNVNHTVWTVYRPFSILLHAVTTDIIAVLTQFVIIIGRLLRRNLIFFRKRLLHLCRTRYQTIHHLCIEQITIYDAVFNDSSFTCLI